MNTAADQIVHNLVAAGILHDGRIHIHGRPWKTLEQLRWTEMSARWELPSGAIDPFVNDPNAKSWMPQNQDFLAFTLRAEAHTDVTREYLVEEGAGAHILVALHYNQSVRREITLLDLLRNGMSIGGPGDLTPLLIREQLSFGVFVVPDERLARRDGCQHAGEDGVVTFSIGGLFSEDAGNCSSQNRYKELASTIARRNP